MTSKTIKAASFCKRLDLFLSENTGISRSHAKNLCEQGFVLRNGKALKASDSVKEGDEIIVNEPKPVSLDLTPQDMPLDIIYQDEDVAVINKAQGVTVHAGGGTKGNTLVNALLYHLDSLSGINGVLRPGIVHRIDKDTSGLLVVAKNDRAHVSLASQIEKKTCRREYIALLEGVVKEDKGRIETFIGRSDKDRKLMAVTKTGRKAATNYEVIKRYKEFTLCRFILETGRTHQIRVHAKYMGHPVVGDKAYGFKKQKFALEGQLLHAYKLTFTHPSTGETVSFTAPLPDYFERVLKSIAATETK